MRTNRLSPFALLLICTVGCLVRGDDEQHDVREGDNVTLQCRFALEPMDGESLTYYWVRHTATGHENVAIGSIPLEINYQVLFMPEDGRFDLLVSNVSYERDNGRFECRVKAGGSGRTLHGQGHALTVLTAPRGPVIKPGLHVQSQEGRELNLSCSSSGGSPEPTVQWFREGSMYPLEATVIHAKTRSEPTIATLTLMPTREDDEATYRCAVWNRAMAKGHQLEATLDLSVNYFPRVEVGAENPLRVEIDATATMECIVDAKPKVTSVKWMRNGMFISNSFTHIIQGVTVQDAGKYTCHADNGLGRPGQKELYLDVLFPPTVTVESKTYEAEEGGNIEIKCDVSANPSPISIEWTMEGDSDFHQSGKTLTLKRVHADMVGTYICTAVNVISSSNGKRAERSSSASVAVLVRHKPGRARISPEKPVAQEGTGLTLTCSAQPPGWPAPQFRWFKDTVITEPMPPVLATGNQFSIPSAHLGSEGVYHCQATNELGHGEVASVSVEVHQPPRFQAKLQTHMTKRSGEQDFALTCSALGKPRPNVKWFKDNAEIKPDVNLYQVKTEVTENRNFVYNVQSTLKFNGKARTNTNDLLPNDRGIFTCSFENEVKKVESTMHLRIEHEPISIQHQDKVAYDLTESAEIACRVQAYPKPEFQWFYGSNTMPLEESSQHYEIKTTTDNNDSYYSVLKIKPVKSQDYGDYYCKIKNTLGSIRPKIRLQPKGAPEAPHSLESQRVGPTYITLKWEAGFEGGLSNTKYFINYRRVVTRGGGAGGATTEHCASDRSTVMDWLEYDCGRSNPCNVTRLDQHSTYSFKVKAVNTKGQSNFSNEITVTTKVERINPPEQVTFDPSTQAIAFTVTPTCLALVGVVEAMIPTSGWQVVDTIQLHLSGAVATVQEAAIEIPSKATHKTVRYATDQPQDNNPRVQLKLCLQVNQEVCSQYTEAEIGPSHIKETYSNITAAIVGIFVTAVVVLLFIGLLFLIYQCRRKPMKKDNSKDYEMDSMRSSKVTTPQNQAPPPYYPNTGMENKALEHSMDLAMCMPLGDDDTKSPRYGSTGYGYHVPPHSQAHPGQPMPNSDWNMGFVENSYTNSNHGGSVNSQDSLWQMKMQTANNPGNIPAHQVLDHQSNYDYDPISHAGYRNIDDYAHYSHLPHGSQAVPPADYDMRATQNPSRQEYCSDPYASVHKPKKRLDQHNIESPYHEVSGLPEYGQEGGAEDKPLHLSLGYDESLESGYSTPNSRARRVIREIIV